MPKYHNKKVIINGEVFDSKREYRRFLELSLLEKAGEIQGLKRQVKFELIPSQREPSPGIYIRGTKRGHPKPGKVIEKEVAYYADFVYWHDGKMVVEDAKGVKTKEYIIKRKLMLHIHGIRIREV